MGSSIAIMSLILKVFADLMSQPARAVTIFCRAANIKHELVNVRITAGDTKTEEYTKMNPLQKVPVLKDRDLLLLHGQGQGRPQPPLRRGELCGVQDAGQVRRRHPWGVSCAEVDIESITAMYFNDDMLRRS